MVSQHCFTRLWGTGISDAIFLLSAEVEDHYGQGFVVVSPAFPPYNNSLKMTTPENGEVEVSVSYPFDDEVEPQDGTVG